ncbi:hypothetical protein EOM09_02225 [bacterium]|nr:hypothetical protein [bacterium]
MKKIIVFLLLIMMVSNAFAGIDKLNLNKETGIMTYVYVIKGDLPIYNDPCVYNRILELRAKGEFISALQEFFYLKNVNLTMIEYEFLAEKIIMSVNFNEFSHLNFRKI